MLHQFVYPLMDLLLYPLFWLSRPWALTVVSILSGLGLLALYRYTSDQWALAHYKDKIKTVQLEFFRGNDRWANLRKIGRLNLKMAGLGLVPSVACIGLLLALIPWVGNRFGHYPFPAKTPIEVTVNSDVSWSIKSNNHFRYSPHRGPYPPGEQTLRILAENPGPLPLTFVSESSSNETITVGIKPTTEPLWPSIQPRQWYYAMVNPSEQRLSKGSPIRTVSLNYGIVFSSLTFTIPYSGEVPGWLSWFFLVSFGSGIWAKFHWEIE